MSTKFGIGRATAPNGGTVPVLVVNEQSLAFTDIAAVERYSTMAQVIADWDAVLDHLRPVAVEVAAGGHAGRLRPLAEAGLVSPLDPPQIFCTGANYRRHVAEIIVDRFSGDELATGASRDALLKKAYAMMDERARSGVAYIFTRILSSCAGPFDDLRLPSFAKQPDWEAELAVVFKTGGENISREAAMDHIAGYMVVNDITSRDQIFTADPGQLGADWLHAKHSPGFFPMGPMIVPREFIADPHDLGITLKLNGKLMQDERTNDMIFDIPRQIETLSGYARILPGDVLATGSPAGNGTHYNRYLQPGDVMEVSVEGLGTQRTHCVATG